MPVAEIADALGFADVQHVARYFRAAKDASPSAFRAAYGRRRGAAGAASCPLLLTTSHAPAARLEAGARLAA